MGHLCLHQLEELETLMDIQMHFETQYRACSKAPVRRNIIELVGELTVPLLSCEPT